MVKNNHVSQESLIVISDEAYCETFGINPNELGEQDVMTYDLFSAVLEGRSLGEQEEMENMKSKVKK